MRPQPIVLDALDQRLLRHFAQRFPRPPTVPFCPYDVSAQAVELLCTHPRPFDLVPRSAGDGFVATDAPVIETFLFNMRYGLFGSWVDFPAFAGFTAVYLRRHSGAMGAEVLAPWFAHLSDQGDFTREDLPVLRQWVAAVLFPGALQRAPEGTHEGQLMSWWVLYATLGGDLDALFDALLALYGRTGGGPLLALYTDGQATAESLRAAHGDVATWHLDQQDDGPGRWVRDPIDPAAVERVAEVFVRREDAWWEAFCDG
jgi:hypothetical protein